MNLRTMMLVVLGGFFCLTVLVQTGRPKNEGAFSFYLGNDVFCAANRSYTHGMKLTWISLDRVSSRFDP